MTFKWFFTCIFIFLLNLKFLQSTRIFMIFFEFKFFFFSSIIWSFFNKSKTNILSFIWDLVNSLLKRISCLSSEIWSILYCFDL
jgi:hypothetical protein